MSFCSDFFMSNFFPYSDYFGFHLHQQLSLLTFFLFLRSDNGRMSQLSVPSSSISIGMHCVAFHFLCYEPFSSVNRSTYSVLLPLFFFLYPRPPCKNFKGQMEYKCHHSVISSLQSALDFYSNGFRTQYTCNTSCTSQRYSNIFFNLACYIISFPQLAHCYNVPHAHMVEVYSHQSVVGVD